MFSVVVPHPYPNLVPRPFCLQWNTRRELTLSLSLSLSLYRGRTHTLSTVALFLTHPCEFLHVKLVLLDAWSLTDPFLIDRCHGQMPTSIGARRGRRAAGRRGGAVGAGGARRGSGRVCVGARGARSALFFKGKGFHADAAHVRWHSIFVVIVISVSESGSVFNYLCTLLRNVRISIISSVFEPSTDSVPMKHACILVEAPPLAVGACNAGFAACCRA